VAPARRAAFAHVPNQNGRCPGVLYRQNDPFGPRRWAFLPGVRPKSDPPAADRESVDPTVVMEGGAFGAAALGFARMRPRKQPRVRREPIDLERLAAEFAQHPELVADPSPADTPPADPPLHEREILRALEAEVERVNATRVAEIPVEPEPEPEAVVVPEVVRTPEPSLRPASDVGLPVEQVRAWLEQVQDDLRQVEARVEYLQLEQSRLQSQHQLVAELLSSSTPV
jgi:hypothetical protein